MTKELKHNDEWYAVREGNPVEVQWVGEDLWWEGSVEITVNNDICRVKEERKLDLYSAPL